LKNAWGIEYETALLVIALLKARGALNERGEVSVSWRAFGQDVPNRIESEPRRQESEEPARHREIRQLVQKAIGGLCDEQTGEQVEVQFDFSVEPPALVIKASPAVVAEAQVRLESVVWPSQPPPPLPPSATRTADQHVSSVPRSKRPKPLSAAQPTVIQNYVLPPLDLLRLPDTRIHIHAPVPGKDCVGIEAPSNAKAEILMHDLLESNEWRDTKAQIPIALGSDLKGRAIIQDLAKMPHLLIAGSTGSGKSVLLHSLILSLLYRFGPDQLCFVMIDPRLVELQHYNVLPHLVVPVVTDPKKVPLALSWVVNEMEKRYQLFALVGMPDIKSFNDRPKGKGLPSDELESLPMVRKEKVEAGADGFAVEVDEQNVGPRRGHLDNLGDFNLIAPTDIEMALGRTAQMGHAAGIHLFLASQYPDKTV
jgi:hypothetical protein